MDGDTSGVSGGGLLIMADVHIYFGIENLAMTNGQRNTLFAELVALGREDLSPHPNRRMQYRARLDNQAGIFEAVFDETQLTIEAVKSRLATIFGVSVASITHTVTTPTLGGVASTVITFTRTGTDYLRMAGFGLSGGVWPSWEQSRLAAIAYLAANSAAWETGV